MEHKNNHVKKMIAPAIVTGIVVLYIIFWTYMVSAGIMATSLCVFGVIIGIALVALTIGVFLERIKEIRSGEEDDLSKY